MPAVDVAMVRSLRGGLWETVKDTIARSLATEVVRRDIVADADNKISDVKQAFSSWNGCMAHVYCKWPAIALMIIGGLILLSIIICICCGNCCGCCDAPGGAARKQLEAPYVPQQSGGYRQEAPMVVNMPSHSTAPAFSVPASHGPPQYAEFDVSKHDADALPAMPSWETANSKQIVLEEEVEMDTLPPKKEPLTPQNMNSPGFRGQQQQQQQQRSMGRNDPYNRQQNNSPGYMNTYGQQPTTSPYGAHDQAYGAHDQAYGAHDQGFAGHDQGYNGHDQGYNGHEQGYNGHDQGYNTHDQGYGAQQQNFGGHDQAYGAHEQQPYGVHEQGYNGHTQGFNGHDQAYGMHDQHYNGPNQDYDNHVADGYGASQPYDHAAPTAGMHSPGHQSPITNQHDYGIPRQMTPGPARMPTAPHELDGHTSPTSYGTDPHMRKSPGPSLNQRRSPGPNNDISITPQNKPVPYRTYTPGPQNTLHNGQASPITNNGGFDFNSGYSRPAPPDEPNYDRRPSESHEHEEHEGYPGFKPYSPAPQGWSGI
ncbi:hypothetical protein TASIC1_0001061200 [Trichoderma asperellum]|uniref:Fibroin-3 n=1 Tax=Trichoderma asperellum TaxID=101201 RepID=A0A6V8QJ17_TRIAP|nr:hypothetical protein TASIC1_0001061200 [Trichoderma asperellum]